MIYGNKFLIESTSGDLTKEMTSVYNKYKAQVEDAQKQCAANYKAKEFNKVVSDANSVIKICDQMIKDLNKFNTAELKGLGKLKLNKYINWANYMKEDAKVAVGQAKLEMQKK